MNRDIFALLESKRALLVVAGEFWLQIQQDFGFTLGDDTKVYMQLALVISWIVSDSIRPTVPKGVLTKEDKRTNGK